MLPQVEAVRAIDLVADALAAVKEGSDARIQLEVALLKAARPRADASVEALLLRVERLGRAAGGEAPPPATSSDDPPAPPKRKESPPKKDKPEPVLAEAPPPPPPREDPIVGIETLWPAVLQRVRESEEGGEMLAALLADARPASLTDDELVLEYPQSASFSKRKIADPVNAERLAEALKLVGGRPVSVALSYGSARRTRR